MNSYSDMRSRITPVPTPPIIRITASVLAGVAVAVLTTDLSPGIKFAVTLAAIVIALLITFCHPYRGLIKQYRAQHNIAAMPTIGQITPLFITWLALMLAPLLSGSAVWLSIVIWIIISGWIFLVFPHIDGSRALAFAEEPNRNT